MTPPKNECQDEPVTDPTNMSADTANTGALTDAELCALPPPVLAALYQIQRHAIHAQGCMINKLQMMVATLTHLNGCMVQLNNELVTALQAACPEPTPDPKNRPS